MTPRLGRVASWLASPRLAAILLMVLGAWSFLGTLVPQGGAGDAKVLAWGAAHPALERMVSAIGFHEAFSSPPFVLTVLLLAASTAVCSWRRTRVAVRRYRLLRGIADEQAAALTLHPTFTVDVSASDPSEPLHASADALRGMGLRVGERDGLVVAGSRPWVPFGSPAFHWALFLLVVVILGALLNRAEGLIGVPVGDSRPVAASSFGYLEQGRLYRFPRSQYVVRVDKLDIVHVVGGIDRGPAPTVSIVRADGSVAARQVVYPNHPLRYKSLIVHSTVIGLSPSFVLVSEGGREGARTNLTVDFAEEAPAGTSWAGFTLDASAPERSIQGSVTVPLEKREGRFVQAVPDPPRATFTLRPAGGGSPVASGTLAAGQELQLPDGSRLRLKDVGYYARLSVVDDPSVPLVYVLLIVALGGVSVSVLGRQSLAVVSAGERATGGLRIDVWFRDWRSNAVRTAQAEEAVREALAPWCQGARTPEGEEHGS